MMVCNHSNDYVPCCDWTCVDRHDLLLLFGVAASKTPAPLVHSFSYKKGT